MNEITIFEANKLDKIAKTGNDRLDKLSTQIMSEVNKVNALFTEVKAKTEAYARACAPLFGEIKRDKLYEKGGFKSLEEYAAQFGVQKSTAYAWARVGEAFFLEDTDCTRKIRDTLTMSNMAELTNTDCIKLAAAIDSKEITGETAQKEIRDFAATHRKDGKSKEKVLPAFTVSDMCSRAVVAENVIKEDMYKAVSELLIDEEIIESPADVFFTTVKLVGDKASAAQHFIAYTASGYVRMFEYRPFVNKPTKAKGKGKEEFDLAAYIAGLTPEQRKALAAMAAGEAEEG